MSKIKVLRSPGIEPGPTAWKAAMLTPELPRQHTQYCKDSAPYKSHDKINTPKNACIHESFHYDYYSIYNAVESTITEHKFILTSDNFYLPKKSYFHFKKIYK